MKSVSGILVFIVAVLILIPLLGCCRKHSPQKNEIGPKETRTVVKVVSPEPNKVIHCGDTVTFRISQTENISMDSVAVFYGKTHAVSDTGYPARLIWNSANSRTGQTTMRLTVYYNDSLQESHNINLVILSDILPQQYTYRVVNKFPHDNQAYTQGLVYDNGFLYEGTGLESKSTLRMVDISTGRPVKMISLAPQYFGEGIALFKDQIYQITYKSQVGFVYDKNTLDQIRSFDYQIKEGWGLTTDGKNLIMSDGSSQLFFIEPEFFTQVDMIRVFDNKGMIDSLNEIEYIKGKVLANVYGQTYIVIVDPATGKVTGKVEFRELMPEGTLNDYGKVLNGIAYNPANGHLYITGKHWPVLYEVQLQPSL